MTNGSVTRIDTESDVGLDHKSAHPRQAEGVAKGLAR